jgi:hypothetical protein
MRALWELDDPALEAEVGRLERLALSGGAVQPGHEALQEQHGGEAGIVGRLAEHVSESDQQSEIVGLLPHGGFVSWGGWLCGQEREGYHLVPHGDLHLAAARIDPALQLVAHDVPFPGLHPGDVAGVDANATRQLGLREAGLLTQQVELLSETGTHAEDLTHLGLPCT